MKTEEQAREFIGQMKKKYYDARHNCWCYLIGDSVVRYSDDGGSRGTAGSLAQRVPAGERDGRSLRGHAVFWRRAAGRGRPDPRLPKSARDALCAAGVSEMGLWAAVSVPCSYGLSERVKGGDRGAGRHYRQHEYGTDIRLDVSLPGENTNALAERLTELSAGGIQPTRRGRNTAPAQE